MKHLRNACSFSYFFLTVSYYSPFFFLAAEEHAWNRPKWLATKSDKLQKYGLMPQDDLKDTVENLDKEMTDRTTEIVTLERRVRVLEQDVKTLVFLCHYIREFATLRVGQAADASFEKFNVAFSELMQRYEVPYP